MDLPDYEDQPDSRPIPPEFESFAEDGPFRQCQVCGCPIYTTEQPYLIERAFKKDEVIFEYAICLDCRTKMQKQISQESQTRVDHYFHEHVDLIQRREHLMKQSDRRLVDWIDHCIITGKSREEAGEYQIMSICSADHMLYDYLPMMISAEAMEEITKLLSPKTKDHLDGFVDEFLGLPPEIHNLDLVIL